MDADFDAAVLGLAPSAQVEAALREAGAAQGDRPLAEQALDRASVLAPDHPAVLIARYRFEFYGHRLVAARDIALRALAVGARALSLPPDWRDVPARPLPGARFEPATRFYLFSLKGLAYLSLRLGDARIARDALLLLRALDPDDCVGGALLEAVRRRALDGDRSDDDDDDAARGAAAGSAPVPAFGAAAWARLPETA